jgi:hypothetical protein
MQHNKYIFALTNMARSDHTLMQAVQCLEDIQGLSLTLSIGIYMTKTLDRVNKVFSRNFKVKFGRILYILVFYKSI